MAAPIDNSDNETKMPNLGIGLPQNNIANVVTTRNYTLNLNKTLRKKINDCEKVSVDYEVTNGGITGRMDTATFELFRLACSAVLNDLPPEEGRCVIDVSQDKRKRALVQQTYRVKRVIGGEELGYTLNLYPTNNRM